MLITPYVEITYTNINGLSIILKPFDKFWLQKISEDVINEISSQKIVEIDGNLITSSTLGIRTLDLLGFIHEKKDIEVYSSFLIKIFNPKITGMLKYFNKKTQTERFLNVIVEKIPKIDYYDNQTHFEINLRATNPFYFTKTETVFFAERKPKIYFPMIIPRKVYNNYENKSVFGLILSSTSTEVINIGDASSGFSLIFKSNGIVINPFISKKNTNEKILFDYEMKKDDIIIVNSFEQYQTVFLNGEKVFNIIDYDSEFFLLDIGKNLILHGAEQNIINLEIYLLYSPFYIGAE